MSFSELTSEKKGDLSHETVLLEWSYQNDIADLSFQNFLAEMGQNISRTVVPKCPRRTKVTFFFIIKQSLPNNRTKRTSPNCRPKMSLPNRDIKQCLLSSRTKITSPNCCTKFSTPTSSTKYPDVALVPGYLCRIPRRIILAKVSSSSSSLSSFCSSSSPFFPLPL